MCFITRFRLSAWWYCGRSSFKFLVSYHLMALGNKLNMSLKYLCNWNTKIKTIPCQNGGTRKAIWVTHPPPPSPRLLPLPLSERLNKTSLGKMQTTAPIMQQLLVFNYANAEITILVVCCSLHRIYSSINTSIWTIIKYICKTNNNIVLLSKLICFLLSN